MDLRAWRKSRNLTLVQGAPILAVSVSTLSDLERGAASVSRETLARIEGATGGQVTADDLQGAFRRLHRIDFSKHREAGRSAMAIFRKTAKNLFK